MGIPGAIALLALAGWSWVVGSALARGRPAAERFVAGALAALALAWTALAAGAVGVALLDSAAAVATLALAAAAIALATRPPLTAPRPPLAPLAVGASAALVVAAPSLRLRLDQVQPSRGDLLWHLGWIHQLERGAAAPGGVYAGEPNGYPWLYHALAGWVAQALPGGTEAAVWALEPFGLAVAGCGTWLLARQIGLREPAAAWSVGLLLAAGALGISAEQAGYRFQMAAIDAGPFHGSPVPALTPALALLPPMIPRDLGLALTPAVLWLVLASRRRPRLWWAAGAAGGLAFLVAPPAGLLCALWALAFAVRWRSRVAWRAGAAGLAVAAVWLVPLAVAAARYHGLARTAAANDVTPGASQTLAALGVTLPLATIGVAVAVRRRSPMLPALLTLVAVPAAAVAVGLVAGQAGSLGAHGVPAALIGWPRWLPFLALALCIPAGAGAADLLAAVARRRGAAVAAAAVLVCLAAGSTALAAASVWRDPVSPTLACPPLPAGAGSRIAVLAPEPAADQLAMRLFSQSGAGFLYLRTASAKVRFRRWLATEIPDLPDRRRAIEAALGGGRPPAAADLVFARPGTVAGARVAGCRFGDQRWDLIRLG